jgi:hypothetical protein
VTIAVLMQKNAPRGAFEDGAKTTFLTAAPG